MVIFSGVDLEFSLHWTGWDIMLGICSISLLDFVEFLKHQYEDKCVYIFLIQIFCVNNLSIIKGMFPHACSRSFFLSTFTNVTFFSYENLIQYDRVPIKSLAVVTKSGFSQYSGEKGVCHSLLWK